jgi:coenzyme F430 synthetase
MRVLVIDTIHGGLAIARHLSARGHFTDTVDIYRGKSGIDATTAASRDYDLAIAPVHLDPGHPLLQSITIPVISHHEAVRWILGKVRPSPFVEITGARGKTTTACALAHTMDGPGILHTSIGTYRFPGQEQIWKKSITPASVLPAAEEALQTGGWMIAEVSLGFTGAGDYGIITSCEDYIFAGGKRHALSEKIRSAQVMPRLLVAPGVDAPGAVRVETVAEWQGDSCTCCCAGREGTFASPLLSLESYRIPLMLAAAAACELGGDIASLSSFPAIPGRMSVSCEGDVRIVDNANSGTNASTTLHAAEYARKITGMDEVTLVIGKETGAVCEGFPADELVAAIGKSRPARVIVVGDGYAGIEKNPGCAGIPVTHVGSLEEGASIARSLAGRGSIVLSVKCWR